MCGLDIVRMVVSPRPSQSFGVLRMWNDAIVICELFVEDRTFAVLLNDSSESRVCASHRVTGVPNNPWVVRILDAQNLPPVISAPEPVKAP